MFTVENVLYIRLILLLTRAGCGVLRKHVAKSFQNEIDFPLHTFLHIKKETIKERFCKSLKQFLLIFPNSSEPPDLLKWDISLLCYLIMELLNIQQSSQIVYTEVKTIRDMRNDLYHYATPSIDVHTFKTKWDDLKNAIVFLNSSSSFTETEKTEINGLITSADKANFSIQTVLKEIREDNPSEDFLEQIQKQIMQKNHTDLLQMKQDISEIKTKMENSGQSTDGVNDVSAQVKLIALDGKNNDSAAKCLLQAIEDSIKKKKVATGQTSDLDVTVYCLIQNIEKLGVKVTDVKEGSVLLTFECSSISSILDLIEYFQGPLIQSQLDKIGKVLTDKIGEQLTLEAFLDLDSLQDIVTKFYDQTRVLKIGMTCSGIEGLQHALDVFEGEIASNSLNDVSNVLSNECGKRIVVESTIDLESIQKAIDFTKEKIVAENKLKSAVRSPDRQKAIEPYGKCTEKKSLPAVVNTDTMSHQSQLEKSKYRNWVRGGLAFKYLKKGIERFTDDVVQKEHTRIIGVVNNTSGNACDQCFLNTLKPIHTKVVDPTTKRRTCPWGQSNCNCLHSKKKPCLNKVCDVIMEEILKSHASTPPKPNWKNTDIHKWYTSPWEIAKCFINAPVCSDKTSAADIDISELLHLFINNTSLHEHLSCKMTGTNIFLKCREGSHKLFHSHAMEMEDAELTECIDDMIAVLEDPKELAKRSDAKQYVFKLNQLKQGDFVITTHNEIETCRTALDYITKKSEELQEDIHNAKTDIDLKKEETIMVVNDKTKHALDAALETIDKLNESLNQRVDQLELNITDIQQRRSCLENIVQYLDDVRQNIQKKFDFAEEKQAFQKKLMSFYKEKLQENDVNSSEVYIDSEMVVKSPAGNTDREPKEIPQHIHNYGDIINTRNRSIYIEGDVGVGKSTFYEMMIQCWCSAVTSDEDKTEDPKDLVKQRFDQLLASKDTHFGKMRKFEFLFFIPFKRIGVFNNVTEMIKAVVDAADLTKADFIDRIFEQESDRCLIVDDGVEEWTPPMSLSISQNVAHDFLDRGTTKNATMITFSPPTSEEIQ